MLRKISGKDCVKILCNKFGFRIARTRGSHVTLKKGSGGTVVPLHPELKVGTLKSVLELAGISDDEFEKYQ